MPRPADEPAQAVKVTLTFDNGPTPGVTEDVLDVLERYGVRSTFFVIGQKLREHRALSQRASEAGHWVGNHTMTHSVQLADTDDPLAPEHEIGAAQAELGALAHPARLFRPYGRGGILDRRLISHAGLDYLRQHSYTCVLWNCVPHDWDDPGGWVERALADVAGRDWSLVVIHDLPTGAMDLLPRFLDGLDDLGAELVQEFPPECTPVERGRLVRPLAHLMPA
ncbi:MAG TPA: polysaccharide deacetylase family protein [Pseudonocardia sp.]|nr:polysaccharide deacetylase family protein [Pseudonocardia sp.]